MRRCSPRFRAALAAGCTLLATACTDSAPTVDPGDGTASARPGGGQSPGSPHAPHPSRTPAETPNGTPTGATASPEPAQPARFRHQAALRDVRALAGRIGPRLATGRRFREAGDLVSRRFTDLGYEVRRQRFPVPAGDSWGVPVDAGRSFNVIATPPGFDPGEPHRIVGAHLDTVAVAPGAEDNASGVAVMLEVARLAAAGPTRPPTVFIAFGAEEPRGQGDALHHFGSQHYVRTMPRRQRDALRAMVSLDRVGVGSVVPVCTGPLSPPRVQRDLLRVAKREDIAAQPCENTASDHWSFEKDGFAVARLGSTSYAAYHSAEDVPAVVNARQLGRVGRLTWAWLAG